MKPLVIPLRLKGRVNIWDLTKEAIARAINNTVDRINQGEIDHYTPKGATGRLQGTFYSDVRGGTIRLIWPEDYAKAVDKGATRHRILPKTGTILSFPDRRSMQRGRKGKGKWAYDGRAIVKYVLDHPGQRAQHFGMRTTKASYGILRQEIEREIARMEGFL